ncbi:hypothetical protein CR513_41083, partial [Mucuna pruriens]
MGPAEGAEQFFYLYDTLHSKLGIKLSFTHFERAVLHTLNVAPTQLHPNSWAFVRAFKLLCEDLGRATSLGLFFWFFSLRKTDRVGWTSLSNRARHKLLRLFLESYKTFKDYFFRVASSNPSSNLLVARERLTVLPTSLDPIAGRVHHGRPKELGELGAFPYHRAGGDARYSTKALKDLRKRKEQASQTAGVEAEAAPLSTARPVDPPQASQEGTSRTPSVFILERATPSSPFHIQQEVLEELADRPSKRSHLEELVQTDHEDPFAGRKESTPRTFDPRTLLINCSTFTLAADQALASSSLGQEVGRLGLQYAAHGFALARAAEKEFGFLESERLVWAD